MSVTAVLGGGIAFFFYDTAKKAKAALAAENDSVQADSPESVTYTVSGNPVAIDDFVQPVAQLVAAFPLRTGSQGGQVSRLQKYLNDNRYYSGSPLSVDGAFGNLTREAVANMQVNPKPAIQDYLAYAIFGPSFREGEITEEFYNKFIA